jgi:hypothetical protein
MYQLKFHQKILHVEPGIPPEDTEPYTKIIDFSKSFTHC